MCVLVCVCMYVGVHVRLGCLYALIFVVAHFLSMCECDPSMHARVCACIGRDACMHASMQCTYALHVVHGMICMYVRIIACMSCLQM